MSSQPSGASHDTWFRSGFERIHAEVSKIRKAKNSAANQAALRDRNIPAALWHLILDGYPPQAAVPSAPAPPSQQGPGYHKQRGGWQG